MLTRRKFIMARRSKRACRRSWAFVPLELMLAQEQCMWTWNVRLVCSNKVSRLCYIFQCRDQFFQLNVAFSF